MKAVVTLEITIDENLCEDCGVDANDLLKNGLSLRVSPFYRGGVILETEGPDGAEFEPFITGGRIITAIKTRTEKRKDSENDVKLS